MFGIVRMIIACAFLICSIIVINKKGKKKRILYAVFTALSVVLVVALSFLPLENLFISFDSPGKAFEYYNFGEYDVELVVEGDDCDLVIGSKDNIDTYLIVPKNVDGWKIGIGSDITEISKVFYDGIIARVFRYKNTGDYFVSVFNSAGGESDISDEYNTRFYSTERYNDTLNEKYVTYYAFISEFDLQYSLNVNGEEIGFD